jgi:HEPN domain-containing protein
MQHEPGSVGRWLQYASGDMAMAEQPMSADVPYLLRCFHAQQAAERT